MRFKEKDSLIFSFQSFLFVQVLSSKCPCLWWSSRRAACCSICRSRSWSSAERNGTIVPFSLSTYGRTLDHLSSSLCILSFQHLFLLGVDAVVGGGSSVGDLVGDILASRFFKHVACTIGLFSSVSLLFLSFLLCSSLGSG